MSLQELIKHYGGKWVAVKPNTNLVVTSGTNAKAVFNKAKEKGISLPTLFKVPTKYIPYIGVLNAIQI